jgi:hypothetical protein
MVPLANPLLQAGGGVGPIRGHHQIEASPLALGRERTRRPSQDHGDGWVGLKPLEQQSHEGPMAADPTNGGPTGWIMGTGKDGGGSPGSEVSAAEVDRAAQSPINKVELGKTDEMGRQGRPKSKPLQQAAAGMGEGIGPLALQQSLAGQGIEKLDAPAGLRQSQGSQGTDGTRPVHPG